MFAQRTTKSFIGMVMAAALGFGVLSSLGDLPAQAVSESGCRSSGFQPNGCLQYVQPLTTSQTIRVANNTAIANSDNLRTLLNGISALNGKTCSLTLYEFSNKGDLVAVTSAATIFQLSFDGGTAGTGILSGTAVAPANKSLVVLANCNTSPATFLKAEITLLLNDGSPSILPLDQTVTGAPNAAITATSSYTKNNFTDCTPAFDTTPALPNGLAISSSTGALSGTPTEEVSTEVTVRAFCGPDYGTSSTRATARVLIEIATIGGQSETPTVTPSENVKVTLCHRTHAENNPYVRITVSVNSVNKERGHKHHDEIFGDAHVYTAGIYKRPKDRLWGDIIPPDPTGQNRWQALNWTALGQQIFNGTVAGCKSQSPQEYYNKLREAGVPAKDIKAELAELEAEQELPVKTDLGPLEYTGTDPVALEEDKDKVTICHRTAAVTNPYRKITVAASSIYKDRGHSGHNDSYLGNRIFNPSITYPANQKKWGDIIPPDPTGKNRWAPLNWTAAGQAMYNGTVAGCSEQTSQEYYNNQREDGKPKPQVMRDLERQNNIDDDPHEVDGTQYTGNDPEVEKTEPREPEFPEGKPEIAQSLSGIVWLDLNRDGLKDPNEPLMPNIVLSVVQLTETVPASSGRLGIFSLSPANRLQPAAVTTVLTDDDGFYIFPSLASGGWQVVAGIPNQLSVTYDSEGSADGAVRTNVPEGGKAFTWVGLVGENAQLNSQLVSQIRGGSFSPAALNGGLGVRPGQSVGPNGSASGPQLAATGSNEIYWMLIGLLMLLAGVYGLRRTRKA
jgi:LPXTG-motif cell wall-anchored protein